jgi:cytosine deaminase
MFAVPQQLDLILRNLRLFAPAGEPGEPVDLAVAGGRIAALGPGLAGEAGETLDGEGRLAVPGFVETHIQLDKTCILDRCRSEEGTVQEAIREVAAAKRDFTVEDVYRRAARTLEKCVLHGAMRMRTHVQSTSSPWRAGSPMSGWR